MMKQVCLFFLLLMKNISANVLDLQINSISSTEALVQCPKNILKHYTGYRTMIIRDNAEVENEIIKNIINTESYVTIRQLSEYLQVSDKYMFRNTQFFIIISNEIYQLSDILNRIHETRSYYRIGWKFIINHPLMLVVYTGSEYDDWISDIVVQSSDNFLANRILFVSRDGSVYGLQRDSIFCYFSEIKQFVFNCSKIDVDVLRYSYENNDQLFNNCKLQHGFSKTPYKPFSVDGNVKKIDNYTGIDEAFMTVISNTKNLTLYANNYALKKSIFFGEGDCDNNQYSVSSYPYFFYDLVFLVPLPNEMPHWVAIYAAFEPNFWLIIGLTFLIFIALVYIISLLSRNPEGYEQAQRVVLRMYGTFIGQSINQPKKWILRLMYISWVIYSIVIIAAYSGLFYSFLIEPIYEKQIKSIEDIVEADLSVHEDESIQHLIISNLSAKIVLNVTSFSHNFNRHDIGSLRKILRVNVLENRNFTMFTSSYKAKYMLRKLKDTSGVDEFNTIQVNFKFGCIEMSHFHPMAIMINLYVQRAIESGLFQKWEDNIQEPSFIADASEPIPLNMNHIWAMHFILFVGLMLSTIVLFIEIIMHKIKSF